MTKSVSTQQAGQALDNTHYLQVSATPCTIFDIEGECSSTSGTAYFIQILGTGSPVSGTTIPLYSELCVAASATTQKNGFSFTYRPIGIDTSTLTNPAGGTLATTGANSLPVYMAISSTDNVYTAVAASTQVQVRYEETYLEQINQTITGDLVTGRDSLTVWATPNALKRLTQFVVTNNNGGTATSGTLTVGLYYQIVTFVAGDNFTNVGAGSNASGVIFKATGTTPTTWSNGSTVNTVSFLMLFGYATPAALATPLFEWTMVYGTTYTEKFGSGITFQQGVPTTYAPAYGCYLYGSSTPQVYTATSSTNWTMQAFNI
jgi:hypothetical protein